jgi:translation initiation factor IF-3
VRVIDAEGEQVGVLSIDQALALAAEAELDLVEIAPQSEPPVCRVMDYGKFLFETNKKQACARKKQKQVQVKEIKFRPGTDIGDYQVKLRNLIRFLEEGTESRSPCGFRGREMAHQELGANCWSVSRLDLEEYGVVEQFPRWKAGRWSWSCPEEEERPSGQVIGSNGRCPVRA